jgi:hypothetical protein
MNADPVDGHGLRGNGAEVRRTESLSGRKVTEKRIALVVAAFAFAFFASFQLKNAYIACLLMVPGPDFYHRHYAVASLLGGFGIALGGRVALLVLRGARAHRMVIIAHSSAAIALLLSAWQLGLIAWHSRNAICGIWPLV